MILFSVGFANMSLSRECRMGEVTRMMEAVW